MAKQKSQTAADKAPVEEVAKPATKTQAPVEEVAKPATKTQAPVEEVAKPATKVTPPISNTTSVIPEGILDRSGVIKVLTSAKLSTKEKIEEIRAKAEPAYATLAAKLLSYQEAMGVGRIDPKLGSGKQYDLLNTLVGVLNIEDYSEFKTRFDIINMAFVAFKEDAFRDVMLFRFSEVWNWNKKDLVTLQHLNTVISTLCDLSARKANLPKIDMMKALDSDEVNLTETAGSNLQKYYTV